MAAEEVKNYVKDISNKEGLHNSIDKTKVGDSFDFGKFDRDIESSFQKFLKDNKNQFTDETTKDNMQLLFNAWLDKQLNNLDEIKDNEIYKQIIVPTNFELQKFSTAIELAEVQDTIITARDVVESDSAQINVQGSELKFKTYIKSGQEKVNPQEVADLFNNNSFRRKDELLNLLKLGDNPDNIRKFQRIVAEIDENGSDDGNMTKRIRLLGKYGVDGKFGGKTLEAFESYIRNNKVTEHSTAGQGVQPETADGQRRNTGSGVDGAGSRVNTGTTNTGGGNSPRSSSPESVTRNTGARSNNPDTRTSTPGNTQVENHPGSTPEYQDESHKIKYLYEGKGGENITIAQNLDDNSTVSIIPTVLENDFDFKRTNDGSILYYTLPNENWEGTVTIKVGDEMHTITIKSKENKEQKSGPKDIYDEIAALDLQNRRDNENFKLIPQYVQKLKGRYQELVKEGKLPVSEDEKTELNKLKGAMNRLLAAYNLNEIERSIAKIKDGTGGITTEKGNLNYYIIPDAIIYIGGKFLSKDEYLQGTNTNKKANIEKTLYKKGTIDLPADGSDFWYNNNVQDLKNIRFKTLILSDDELFTQSNTSGRTEIQYDAYGYGSNLEKKEFNKKARVAVNKLTRGLDDDLSIVSKNYNMMPGERGNLSKLRQGLQTLVKLDEDSKDKQNNITITDVFNFIATKNSENFSGGKKEWKGIIQSKYPQLNDAQAGHIAELGALYTAYKKDQDTHKMGDYFHKVMGLLENYFVRGVGEGDEKVTTFVDMYKREEIGIDKDVIDPDKQRKAIKLLFRPGKKDNQNLLGGIGFEKSDKLTALENIVKNNKFNLADFFRKWGVGVDPKDLNKPEKGFYALYEQYLEKLNSGDLDGNHKPNISESEYYNAVFDFLVGIGAARKDIVSAVNSLRLYDSEISDDEAKKCGFEYGKEMKLICMLTDTNFDGREDFADIDGFRTGLEIKSIYKDVKVDKKYGLIQKEPIQNLLDFATQYASHDSDTEYKLLKEISENISEEVSAKSKEIDKNENLSDEEKAKAKDKLFYDKLREQLGSNRQALLYLQRVLVNTPVEGGVGNIFRYGASAEVTSEKHELSASEKAIKEIMDNQEFNATFEREYQKLVEQGLEDTPQVKAKFKPIIAAGVFANLMGEDPSYKTSLAVGGVWDTKVGDFTLLLGVGASIEGGFDPDSVGIGISRGKSWSVGKSTNIYTWAGTGATVGMHGEKFTLLAATGIDVSTLVNKNRLKNSLKSHPECYFHTGVSVGAGFSSEEDGRGVYVEGHMGYSKDRLKGIQTQSENLKKELGGDNGVIMNILSQLDLGGKETSHQRKQTIRTELEKKYYNKKKKKTAEETRLLNQATDNIYERLAYYMVGINMDGVDEDTQKNIKKDIANNLAEAYAVSFVNEEIAKIEGKTELTGLGLSVIYYLGMLFPVGAIGFNISTYKGIYATETAESKSRYQDELMTGAHAEFQGNDIFYDDSDPDNIQPRYNEMKDKDGNTVKDKDGNPIYESPLVNWINDKLQVANGNVQLPKINFKVEKGGMYAKGRRPERVILKLPKDLYKYVNINIKSKLQNSVQTDTNGDLLVPGNTMIRLLTSSKVNTGKFNLIIGGLQAEDSDLIIAPNQELYGTPAEYAGEVSTYQLDVDRFNDNLNAFIESHKEDEYSDFPIQKCEKVVNENGESKALLKLTPSLNIQDMGSVNSKTEIKDGYIYTPSTGTLTVYKDKEGKFHLYYQSNPKNDLKINYEIEGQDQQISVEDTQQVMDSYKLTFNESTDIFDVAGVEDLFRGIEKELSDVDNGKWKSYVEFMENTCDVISGGTLNQQDYDTAYDTLLQMLNKTNISKLKELKDKLKDNNMTAKDKVMVVDRFKMIFSYLPQLTDGKTDGKNLSDEINRRGTKYRELLGYDKSTPYPLTTDYRSTIVEKLKANTQINRVPVQNLFGMTAFYKTGWVDNTHTTKVKQQLNQAYGYSMTQMGHTNVLGGVEAMETIRNDELANTREWFVNNLEKSDVHSELLYDMLEKNVNSLLSGKVNVKGDIKLDKSILIKLLKGETDIVIGKSIDNGGENDIMLSGDLKYVFYLLGECGNESIGVQLNGLTVRTNKTIITEQISTQPGEPSKVTVYGNTKRTGGPGVATSTHEAVTQKNTTQHDFGMFMGGGAQKGTPTTEGDTIDTPTTEGDTIEV